MPTTKPPAAAEYQAPKMTGLKLTDREKIWGAEAMQSFVIERVQVRLQRQFDGECGLASQSRAMEAVASAGSVGRAACVEVYAMKPKKLLEEFRSWGGCDTETGESLKSHVDPLDVPRGEVGAASAPYVPRKLSARDIAMDGIGA